MTLLNYESTLSSKSMRNFKQNILIPLFFGDANRILSTKEIYAFSRPSSSLKKDSHRDATMPTTNCQVHIPLLLPCKEHDLN